MRANDWLSLIETANFKGPDVIPKGFLSIQEIAKTTGKAKSTVSAAMKLREEQGKVEMQMFRTIKGRGKSKHYRIK